MRRQAMQFLVHWLTANGRKPLIIMGVRQVGKTWLVRALAQQQNKRLIELNFERNLNLADLFVDNDPQRVLRHLEAHFGQAFAVENSLLFLDEIQAQPTLLAKLRWFAEELPQLPVIAAGSLLEFTLAKHNFSMPVGRISYMYLEPLSFEEFLWARQQDQYFQLLQDYQFPNTIPLPLHEKITELFKEYILVGGLPAAVLEWCNTQSMAKVNQVHQDLLATYRDDFAKYAGKLDIHRLDEIMLATPKMLGNKFVFSQINNKVNSASLKQALHLLDQAKICHIIYACAANGIPIAAEQKKKLFKVIYLDVGLVSASLGLQFHQINQVSDINLVNQGGVSEQVVGQLLRTINPFYVAPKLYYWVREQKGSAAEVDYLLQHNTDIVPIEIKSGSTGGLKSLHLMMYLKKLKYALRINSDVPSMTTPQVKLHNGEQVRYSLMSLPMYLVGQINRLLTEWLQR